MTIRLRRASPAPAALLLGLLLLSAGCAAHQEMVDPPGRDFLDFPDKYLGKMVRLFDLDVARVEIGRPLVFTTPDEARAEIVVSDARSLVRLENIHVGERVNILIECTEGRTERGNLLLAVERPGVPSFVDPNRK